jgi:hypothetical protein
MNITKVGFRVIGMALVFFSGTIVISTIFGLISWDYISATVLSSKAPWISQYMFLSLGLINSLFHICLGDWFLRRGYEKCGI